jgi:hypothetical protein
VFASLFVALVSTGVARAAEPLPVPPGFRLAAANGYTVSVLAGQSPKTKVGFVFVFVISPHAQVIYSAPASVTPTSIEADLAPVGRIDVDFAASGVARVESSPCGGHPVSFDSGSYVGSIDFKGEEGYSEAHATSARGEFRTALGILCSGGPRSEGSGGHSPGARLTAHRQTSPRVEFGAVKNSSTRPARFGASVEERRGPLQIFRAVETTAGPGAFDFDVPKGFAHVSPPAPFSGEATYRHPPGKRTSWQGDLAVDFPGRSDFDLTGAGIRAGMHRAVLNPGHRFRVHARLPRIGAITADEEK